MLNAISVDLEDWYHICGIDNHIGLNEWSKYRSRLENSIDKILELFNKHNVRATFFVVGFVAENAPALIKKIADADHEVATHGFFHRRVFDMTPEEFEHDLLKSRDVIEAASGKKVLGYRAPEWSLKKSTLWALDILKKHGFAYDASGVPLSHLGGKHFGFYPHKIKTAYGDILEFPLSTFRAFWERVPFSGGLPMRLVPYYYILKLTKETNRAGYPAIFYIHPWEFDSERVAINLPFNRKFMHYFNLGSTSCKVELLLKYLAFSTVEEVLGLQKVTRSSGRDNKINSSHVDGAYLKSSLSTYLLMASTTLIFLIVASLMGYYSLLLIAALATIWYWPWGAFFKSIGRSKNKKECHA